MEGKPTRHRDDLHEKLLIKEGGRVRSARVNGKIVGVGFSREKHKRYSGGENVTKLFPGQYRKKGNWLMESKQSTAKLIEV